MPAQLLLITGGTRSGSTSTAALRTAADMLGGGATLFAELEAMPEWLSGDGER
jgi:NAD(P)H-dependent FMN reductase